MNKINERILMPTALTAENGAKGALIGEYYDTIGVDCPECHGDLDECEKCESCLGRGSEDVKVTVQWTTIKQIYKDCVELFRDGVPTKDGVTTKEMKEKPTELPCKRIRAKLNGDDFYIIISYLDNRPWEIFSTTPCSWEQGDQRKGFMGAINRLAALSLQRGMEVAEVVDQLRKSSAGKGDYAGILAELLDDLSEIDKGE